jgi:hypothetical protein
MKTFITLLVIIMISSQAFGQRKAKKEAAAAAASADSNMIKIDSLNKVSKTLALQLDSVSGELTKYMEVYNAIKDKVIHYSFDPTRSSYLIDSLKSVRDSAAVVLGAVPISTAAADSVAMLVKENAMLKSKIDSVKIAWAKNMEAINAVDVDKVKAVSSLKQLRELLDSKIITEAEFTLLKKKYLEKL